MASDADANAALLALGGRFVGGLGDAGSVVALRSLFAELDPSSFGRAPGGGDSMASLASAVAQYYASSLCLDSPLLHELQRSPSQGLFLRAWLGAAFATDAREAVVRAILAMPDGAQAALQGALVAVQAAQTAWLPPPDGDLPPPPPPPPPAFPSAEALEIADLRAQLAALQHGRGAGERAPAPAPRHGGGGGGGDAAAGYESRLLEGQVGELRAMLREREGAAAVAAAAFDAERRELNEALRTSADELDVLRAKAGEARRLEETLRRYKARADSAAEQAAKVASLEDALARATARALDAESEAGAADALKAQAAALRAQLGAAEGRASDARQALAARDGEVARLRAERSEWLARRAALESQLAEAAAAAAAAAAAGAGAGADAASGLASPTPQFSPGGSRTAADAGVVELHARVDSLQRQLAAAAAEARRLATVAAVAVEAQRRAEVTAATAVAAATAAGGGDAAPASPASPTAAAAASAPPVLAKLLQRAQAEADESAAAAAAARAETAAAAAAADEARAAARAAARERDEAVAAAAARAGEAVAAAAARAGEAAAGAAAARGDARAAAAARDEALAAAAEANEAAAAAHAGKDAVRRELQAALQRAEERGGELERRLAKADVYLVKSKEARQSRDAELRRAQRECEELRARLRELQTLQHREDSLITTALYEFGRDVQLNLLRGALGAGDVSAAAPAPARSWLAQQRERASARL
jgi:hypothetical protein